MIKLKRIYDDISDDDGFRVLVDGLWPRGLSKDKAQVDFWAKDVAPSQELRKWFQHDPKKWEEFQEKYHVELQQKEAEIEELQDIIKGNEAITLLYAAKDTEHNNAKALKSFLVEEK